MDLNRLYNLTTPELRTEAERLGVRDTYAMSRGQLIHAIRSRAGEPQPEGLLGKVLGFAKWAIQTTASVAPRPEDDEATRFKRPSEVPVPSVPPAPESESTSGTTSESASVPESASGTASAPASVPESASGTTSESASVPESASALAPAFAFGSEESPAVPGPSGSSSRPPAGVFSRGASSFEEPFPTRTMARILAEQGHFKRALAIYAKLLAEEPDDRDLSMEAEEVRARSRARRTELQ